MLLMVFAIIAASTIAGLIVAKTPSFVTPHLEKRPENIDGTLKQLIEIEESGGDFKAFATNHGLDVEGERIKVVIELNSEDAEIPQGYNLRIEARKGRLVQAVVSIKNIRGLAKLPQVKYIGVPQKPAI
ncbi:MAG: hypothetical protein QXF26_05125 [Candidatus Bathyarchaeia archaeon]